MERQKSFLLLLLLSLFSSAAFLSAEDLPLPTITEPSGISEQSLIVLDNLLTQLELEALSLNDGSVKLQSLLVSAQNQLTELSFKLAESQTALKESNSLLEQSEKQLTAFTTLWRQERAKLSIELWIWRGATIAALCGLILVAVK